MSKLVRKRTYTYGYDYSEDNDNDNSIDSKKPRAETNFSYIDSVDLSGPGHGAHQYS